MLTAHHISKSYPMTDHEVMALNDIHFSIPSASTLGIQGASGAGKSTLLAILGGLDQPTSGHVTVFDHNLSKMSESQESSFRNQNLGYLFQFHHLLADLTLYENVCLPLWIAGHNRSHSNPDVLTLFERLGLADLKDRYPAELSGGEQQRAALARAVIHKPKLILADEPTGSLDEKNAENVFSMLLELQKEIEATLVVVSHRKDYVTQMQHQLVLEKGAVKSFD